MTALATAAVLLAVLLITLRSPTVGLVASLVVIGSASSVWEGVDERMRTVRWGALVGLIAASAWLERRDPRHRDRAVALVAPFALLALLSTLWSVYPHVTIQRAVSFAALLVALTLVAPRIDARVLGIASAVVAAGLALLAFALWLVDSDTALLQDQLRGELQNPNTLGLAEGLLVPLSLAAGSPRGRDLAVRLALLVPAAVCISASGSRTGLLVAVVGLVVLALCARSLRVPLAAGAALLVVSTLVFSLTPLQPSGGGVSGFVGVRHDPGLHRGRLTTMLGGRDEAWRQAAHIVAKRPIEGFGFGTGEDRLYTRFHASFVWFQGGGPSNGYVQLAMDLGLLGLLALAVPLIAAIRRAASCRDEDAWLPALLAMSLAAAVFESTLTSAGAPWAYLVWLPVVALLSGARASRAG